MTGDFTHWWTRPFRTFQTNLREIDAGLDVDATLDYIEDFGANAWLINAGGILSFYPSNLPFQKVNTHLRERKSGDLVGDALAAAHARGIRLLARMDFSKLDAAIANEHPDWVYRSADGRRQEYNGLISVCPSAPYYQERIFEVIDEVCGRYPVDGLFVNNLSFNEWDYSYRLWGPCHCEGCQSGFARFSGGTKLPSTLDDPAREQWRRYAKSTTDDVIARLRERIASHLPEAMLILGRAGDIPWHEANTAIGRKFWPHATGTEASLAKTWDPGRQIWVNAVAFVDMPYRFAPVEGTHFANHLVQAISRGALPSTYIMGTPMSEQYELEPARDVVRFHRDHEDVYAGLAPNASVLLVRTGEWYSRDPSREEFSGLYQALQRAHIPFDVVRYGDLATVLDSARVDDYGVIVVPETGPLTAEQVAGLDGYVARGGSVLCTGNTGFLDGDAQLTSSPAVRRVAYVDAVEDLKNTYAATPDGSSKDGYRRVSPVAGSYSYVDLAPDAEVSYSLLAQAPFGPPEKCHGAVPLPYPGVATRTHGLGRSVLVPWMIGATARWFGMSSIDRIIAGLVDELDTRRRLRADIAEPVEVVVGTSSGRDVVHLLNFSGVRHNSIGPAVPVHGGRLHIPALDPSADVQALVAGRNCDVIKGPRPGEATIEVPEVGLFEVLVINR